VERLRATLKRIDGRGFKAYQDLVGHYAGGFFKLLIERVQPDPFARPTRMRVQVPAREAAFPGSLLDRPSRRVALGDLLARRLRGGLGSADRADDARSGGRFSVIAGAQTVIPRTAVIVEEGGVEARFTLGLPAAGRRVLGREAAGLLCEKLPRALEGALLAKAYAPSRLEEWIGLSDDQQAIRGVLDARGLVAFVANGAVLPRRSGVDDRPLVEGAIPFQSPPTLEVEIPLPGGRSVRGMGIRRGITLIVGGGYHGKSTLLSAIARSVYDHVGGDGRERVITVPDALKVRAESGRSVEGVDLRPFLGKLPGGRDTADFSTPNASGSTSQAASIIEALEMGCRVLLLDEDTCATNFMVRDARMQALVPDDLEPITSFLDKARLLFEGRGVSTLLVMGGAGDYLDVADCVILMDRYRAREVTSRAREVAAALPTQRRAWAGKHFGEVTARCPDPASLRAEKGRREARIDLRGARGLLYGREVVDLQALEQIEEPAQTRAIGRAMHLLATKHLRRQTPLRQAVESTFDEIGRRGLDVLTPYPVGDLALPRPLEIAAAINRFRGLRVRRVPPPREEESQ
jgi:predicted ABC-class ATPase